MGGEKGGPERREGDPQNFFYTVKRKVNW